MLSTSSKNIILNGVPIGLSLQKFLMSFLTVSIPLASDAFNSRKFCFQYSPRIDFTSAIAVVVFPTPAGPVNIKLGMLPSPTYFSSLVMICFCPTMSSKFCGLYFSTHGPVIKSPFLYVRCLCFLSIINVCLMFLYLKILYIIQLREYMKSNVMKSLRC